ncbi:acyl-CoA dehydrogenase C-terminal domain-containing protein [Paremcibacter congregatus]|uniref:acyl-CoA dehydrogenase C-terminal domain-containing protein n=1 Tax=Paremcibacter congregatus TaxID=2043170 RepID=UPI003A8FA853
MTTYTAPVMDMEFIFQDILDLYQYKNLPGFQDSTPDIVSAILREGAKVTEEVFHPLNQSGDAEGCQWQNGDVTTPKGFKQAYKTYVDGGWNGLTADPEYGGQGMPYVLGLAINEMLVSANHGLAAYPGLTQGAIEALQAHASDALKQTYLPKLISGEWSGTMNLTEPQCGTDLNLMRTRATKSSDGTYRLTGTKIFISSGEHDITDNIIHLVIAKTEGGPDNLKGVSLFLVPKFLPDDTGAPGVRNGVRCGSIEHKMGIHGNSTCEMIYEDAVGYLVGHEFKGMRAMFTMMNAARLGVSVQGICHSEASYQNAAVYARERLQGRSVSGVKNQDQAADPIIVHPDVRRMLMTSRAFNEGARALALWIALQVDLAEKSPDEKARQDAHDLLDLLTPVIKAFFTDKGYEYTNANMQIFGGHGYVVETGMEQYVRDCRITQIYEGANGIHGLDLVGRKLPANGGRAAQLFLATLQSFIETHQDNAAMAEFIGPLGQAMDHLQQATLWLMENAAKSPDHAAASSMEYLSLMAHTAMAYMWNRMALAALNGMDSGKGNQKFYHNKLITARFYMARMLPDILSHLEKLKSGADCMMALDAEDF